MVDEDMGWSSDGVALAIGVVIFITPFLNSLPTDKLGNKYGHRSVRMTNQTFSVSTFHNLLSSTT